MNKLINDRVIYIILLIIIGLDLLSRVYNNLNTLILYIGLFLIIVINNYFRMNYFYNDRNKYFISMFIYIIMSNYIIYSINGNVNIFNFMIIYELAIFNEGKITSTFIAFSIFITSFITIFRKNNMTEILNMEYWLKNSLSIAFMIFYLLFYTTTLLSYRTIKSQKNKVEKLNIDLEKSYRKLLEQSKEIEALTITKERNRVAGEIHDSLGHDLVALNMNLDITEKIIDKDIEKTKELLKKSKTLAEKSMSSLRKAVYALKDDDTTLLSEKLKEIIDNIQSTEEISVILDQDEQIERVPLEYKGLIYKSIKEAITNSIKHGKSSKIKAEIKIKDNKINMSILDNGLGCNNFIKGNGLLGIEEKVNEIDGEVIYNIIPNQGFQIKIIFPVCTLP